jgi:GNAT superfamily N-acetyltransferase
MTPATSSKVQGSAIGSIRSLGPAEFGLLIEIFKAAIPASWLERSIYGASGAERFLAAASAHPALTDEECCWVYEVAEGSPAAAAHFRRTPAGSHLNYIAVLQSHRGSGIASRMMAAWESHARQHHANHLSLDVLDENLQAHQLYDRLGFQKRHRIHEHRLHGPLPNADFAGVRLEGWAQAQAMFHCYGFGRFALSLGDDRFAVDLRDREFRLESSRPDLLAALAFMDPTRSLVLRSPEPPSSSLWTPIGASWRLIKAL